MKVGIKTIEDEEGDRFIYMTDGGLIKLPLPENFPNTNYIQVFRKGPVMRECIGEIGAAWTKEIDFLMFNPVELYSYIFEKYEEASLTKAGTLRKKKPKPIMGSYNSLAHVLDEQKRRERLPLEIEALRHI